MAAFKKCNKLMRVRNCKLVVNAKMELKKLIRKESLLKTRPVDKGKWCERE